KQKGRVGEAGEGLTEEAGARGILLRKKLERRGQSPAAIAGVEQGDVKRGEPGTGGLECLPKRGAGLQLVQYAAERLAVGRERGRAPLQFERLDEPDARGGELLELMIKIGAPGELAGGDEKWHRPALGAGLTRPPSRTSP